MIPMDWLLGLAGSLMIGTTAALFLLMNGRIMGASGILGSLVDSSGRTAERAVFVAGLIAVPGLVALFTVPATNATSSLSLLLLGGLVGLGLLISGITDTTKVQGWLDLFSAWDPTLAFVMGGAILPMLVAWRIAARRETALLGGTLPTLPATPRLNAPLFAGAVLFGFGWTLVGLCPGPALVALSCSDVEGVTFVAAMITGMTLHSLRTPRTEVTA